VGKHERDSICLCVVGVHLDLVVDGLVSRVC
jgi:hypothetical protein